MFVLVAVSATLNRLGISLPAWLPFAFSKSSNMPVGLLIFLWLFLTPFIGVGLLLFGSLLNSLGGRTEVRLNGRQGVLFTGIGPVGFRKRFEVAEVRDVRLEDRRWQDRSGCSRHNLLITIETSNRSFSFGSMFNDQRRRFVAGALKKELSRL